MSKPETTTVSEEDSFKFKERRRFQSYKQKAHFYFDKIWQEAKVMTREQAYKWLANILDLTKEEAHFSYFNDVRCKEAIYFCQQLLNDNRRLDLDFGGEPITPFYTLNQRHIQLGIDKLLKQIK